MDKNKKIEALKKSFGKDAIDKIKKLFAGEGVPDEAKTDTEEGEKKEMAVVDYVAKDGSKIKIEPELAIGSVVTVSADESGYISAPDGEIILEDGTKITVAEGIVKEIEKEEVEDVPLATSEEVAEAVAQFSALKSEFALLTKKISNVEKENAALKKEISTLTKNTSEQFTTVIKGVEEVVGLFEPTKFARQEYKFDPATATGADREIAMRRAQKQQN